MASGTWGDPNVYTKAETDAAIQQSTAGADGCFKSQDGTMIQWGKNVLSRAAGRNSASVTYPYSFAARPVAWASNETASPDQFIVSVNNVNTNSLTLILYNTGSSVSSSTDVTWFAIGRWK